MMTAFLSLFSPALGQPLAGFYDPALVALSVAAAILTSTLALQMLDLASGRARWLRVVTVLTSSVALGAGVWAMHFIAMLAFNLCTVVGYDPLRTGLSMLPSLLASAVALTLLSRPRIGKRDLLIGGTVVGGGIGTMHYVGMSAMRMAPELRYDPWLFGLSVLVAAALAILALWIRFGLRRRGDLLLSGTVMGLAIVGMHYTGMAAARFYGDPSLQSFGPQPLATALAFGVFTTTLLVVLLVAATNGLLRYRALAAEIRASEARARALATTAIDAIISISGRGIILGVNPATEIMFGWGAEEMIGQNVSILMPEPHRSEHDGYLARYLRTGEKRIIGSAREVMARRKDGSTFPIRLAVGHARLEEGELFVGIVTDISERRLMEQDLRDAKNRAEQAAAARAAFLANMSHEIRTPMNAIIGFVEILLTSKLDSEQARSLGVVRNSARSLLRLLNDILDSAKLDRGAMELLHLPFELRKLVEEVVAAQTAAADAKGLRLGLSFDSVLPPRHLGDEMRIRQVLTNLLGNAVKFTAKGSVELTVRLDQGHVHFVIADTGIGIAADRLERIFDPFTQADLSLARRYGGTGLGTTISKQLVELMSGRIWVESEEGKGSRFHVRLPLVPTSDSLAEPAPIGAPPLVPALRILAADDAQQNLDLLQLMMAPLGHVLTLVGSGEEVLKLVSEQSFDLVLLDIRMPSLGGLETARLIRQQEREAARPAIPIIALSASVLDADRSLTYDAGMDGFVAKPVERHILLHEIARVLGIGEGAAPVPGSHSRVVFDRPAALHRWNGDWAVLGHMLEDFFTRNRLLRQRLGSLLESGAVDQAAQLGHRVRGVAANLGLADLAAALAAFEASLDHPKSDLSVVLQDVESALESALRLLEPELAGLVPVRVEIEPGDPMAIGRGVEILRKAFRSGALDDGAMALLAGNLPEGEIAGLRNALDNFDFVEAERQLDRIGTRLGG